MSLIRLTVKNVKNITSADLELHPELNLFTGRNGSGKTSLLEAVYFLGSARSFRNNQLEPLLQREQQDCTVFGVVQDGPRQIKLGVHRYRDGRREIKVNGEDEPRATNLATELPILTLGPDTVDLILGPPSGRRKLLNWGVFHVKHSFASAWTAANRCLRQRNELLRRPTTNWKELNSWTEQLVEHAEAIDQERRRYMDDLSEAFSGVSRFLTELQPVKCQYLRGWDQQRDLAEIYKEQTESDLRRGYTQSGYHRADVRISVEGQSAATVCSRGELKVLAWTLVLSQGQLQSTKRNCQLVYLVDDVASELDEGHRNNICQLLLKNKGQVLATGIDEKTLKSCWDNASRRVFHVKHGNFRAEGEK